MPSAFSFVLGVPWVRKVEVLGGREWRESMGLSPHMEI
jgi:hypothetical protein